jgi:probable addiction module antidote protein
MMDWCDATDAAIDSLSQNKEREESSCLQAGTNTPRNNRITLPKILLAISEEAFMIKITTTSWDSTSHLTITDDLTSDLKATLQDGDHQLITFAVGESGKTRGLCQNARETVPRRENLHKSLTSSCHPEAATALKVISH